MSRDGKDNVVIGAHWYGSIAARAGAVYVLNSPTSSPSLDQANAFIVTNTADAHFGASLSSAGDLDGDGIHELIIDAYSADEMEDGSELAVLFYGPIDGQPSANQAQVSFLEENTGDHAGISVAGGGDVDGDGRPDLVIGASHGINDTNGSGSVYLFKSSNR